jgi:anti-sigma regulatory factor (Ser/Thr protein kinase)
MGKPAFVERHWTQAAEVDAVPFLRNAVCDFAAGAGVLDPPLAQLRLAVSEALTNVVIHGYRHDASPGQVAISATVGADQLRVVVADTGVGTTPRTDSPGSGFGLPIMAAVADSFEIRRGEPSGTEVHMTFNL